jgi:hypothetical protein
MLQPMTLLRAHEYHPIGARIYHGSTSSVISAPLGRYLGHLRRSLLALGYALSLTATLSGCALYNASEKCGLHDCPGDAQITARVRSQLDRRSDLEPNVITVQTLDHVVYLYGLMSSDVEIDTAESIARQVPGVTRVVSSMAVLN